MTLTAAYLTFNTSSDKAPPPQLQVKMNSEQTVESLTLWKTTFSIKIRADPPYTQNTQAA